MMPLRLFALVVVAVVVASSTACLSHVQLARPPGEDGDYDARVTYYQAHRTTISTTIFRGYSPSSPIVEQVIVRLGDGHEIHYPEDLLPAVAANSPTARAVREAQELRAKALPWTVAGAGLVFTGSLLPLAAGSLGELALYGGLGMVAVGVFPVVMSGLTIRDAAAASRRAYASYDHDLLDRLRLRAGTVITDERDGEHRDVPVAPAPKPPENTPVPASASAPAPSPSAASGQSEAVDPG